MIFDTHSHYDDGRFDEDRDELIASFPENGIGAVCNVCSDLPSLESVKDLVEKYDFFYGAVGIHPSDCGDLTQDDLDRILLLTQMERIVAVGEIGLDYYWDTPSRSIQKEWFSKQLTMAVERHIPVVIHSRQAPEDTYDIMKACRAGDAGGVVHCYSYDRAWAEKFLDMGFYLGIGGVVTFKNSPALRETVEYMPAERIVVETDCPYLAPEPYRGKRNSSLYLKYVISKIAQLKGLSNTEVEDITWENACRLYRIWE